MTAGTPLTGWSVVRDHRRPAGTAAGPCTATGPSTAAAPRPARHHHPPLGYGTCRNGNHAAKAIAFRTTYPSTTNRDIRLRMSHAAVMAASAGISGSA